MDLLKAMGEVRAPRPKVARPIVMIGAGGIVNDAHLPAYRKAGFPVAALVDVNREKGESLAKKFGVPFVSNTIAEAVRYAPADAVFDVAVPAKVIPVPDTVSPQMQAIIAQPYNPTWNVVPKTPDEWKAIVDKAAAAVVLGSSLLLMASF